MDSVIKSPTPSLNTLEEIIDEDKPRVNTIADQESELVNISGIRNIDNPVYTCQDKNDNAEIFLDDKTRSLTNENNDCISTTDNSSELVDPNKRESKDSDSIASAIGTAKTMNRPLRNRVSCRKAPTKSNEDKKKTGKNTPRKVLGEKQATCNRPMIFLRSNRKRDPNRLSNNRSNSIAQVSDENQTTEASGKGKVDEENCGTDKKNTLRELAENSNPSSLGNEKENGDKMRTRKTFPYESLPLMEKILIREHEMLENMCNDQTQSTHQTNENEALDNGQKSSANGSTDSGVESEIVPKKRFHRRKCSEPLKNERVQTRQSRNITLTQNKNEYKYFTQVPKDGKCSILEPDKRSNGKIAAEECAIICTPDINMNVQVKETFSDENENLDIGSSDKENDDKVGYKKNAQHALGLTQTSPGDKVPSCKKNDPKSSSSINSRISPKETSPSIAETNDLQSCKKRGVENADGNPKRKLRHLNAQAMPVYLSRAAVTKNECKSKTSDTDNDKYQEKESPAAIKMRTQHCFSNVSSCSKSDKATDPRCSYLSNTDSEETLSNVESVPNSPAQDIWPKATGRNVKFSSKSVELNRGQSSSGRKDSSAVVDRIPPGTSLDIAGKNHTTELKSTRKRKRSQTGISSTWNCGAERDESELQYYVETSGNKNPSSISDKSQRNTKNNAGDNDFGGAHETPWLRHYERPHKTSSDIAKNASEFEDNRIENSLRQNDNLYHQQQQSGETSTNKKTSNTSTAENPVPDNLHAAEGYMFKSQSGKLPQPVSNPTFKKRGRPRKEDRQSSKINSERNKKNGSTSSGSGLRKQELERLFFKFLQDGHFRIEPGKSTAIFIPNNDLYGNSTPRMQCYDPKRYFMPPQNMGAKNNPGSKTYPHFPTDNDGSRFYPSNNSQTSGELGHRLRTLNPNAYNFSSEHMGQTTYSKNLNPYSMRTNIHSENTGGHNTISHTNSLSNYIQSGYGGASNYHQNLYNSNLNVMGNNSYANSFCGMINPNSSMNDDNNTGTAATNLLSTPNNFDDDFNLILNTHNHHQNSMPSREMDLTTSNDNTVSSNSMNSMQNSPASNVNADWNLSSVNQQPDSVNGMLMDLNSMNNSNRSSQAVDGNPDSNNFINNSNFAMNGSSPWMNRSNNVMNPRFPVLPPWHASLPMYNSYLNNGNSYYNNMFNPYAAIMSFDFPNYPYANMNSRNTVGINNENQWMQNIHPNSDANFNFNTTNTNTEFSNMNSGSLQENTSNQGMNLSLTSDTILPQTNSLDLDNTNLGNELNSDIELFKEDTFAQVKTDDNNDLEQSSQGSYGEQKSLPYSLGYKNDAQSIDFNEVNMVNINENTIHNHQQENLSQIQDYINQRSETLEEIVNRTCRRPGSLSCEIVGELTNNRETEMSKLRQELADFTRQYSEDQTSPTSQIPQGDEIFI